MPARPVIVVVLGLAVARLAASTAAAVCSEGDADCSAEQAPAERVLLQMKQGRERVELEGEDAKGAFCCMAAPDPSNICGTCYPGAAATSTSWCGQSQQNCQACGNGKWCSDPSSSTPAPPAPATTPTPTSAPPTQRVTSAKASTTKATTRTTTSRPASTTTTLPVPTTSSSPKGTSQGPGASSQPDGTFGYAFLASTTLYGQTPMASCGSVNTEALVQGLGYVAVATAQAMQSVFTQFGGCGWECQDASGKKVDRCEYVGCGQANSDGVAVNGCTCQQTGACWCGQADPKLDSLATGVAAMGCFACARGRFAKQQPYMPAPVFELSAGPNASFASDEIRIVVADVCPYGPNSKWCPAVAGEVNACGLKNHLDFTAVPKGINNNYFVFTPEPCSDSLRHRYQTMSQCRL